MTGTRALTAAFLAAAASTVPQAEASFLGFKTSFTADPQNPTREEVLTPRATSNGFTVMSNDQEEVMTTESSEFMAAVMRSFLAKQQIPESEMQCLQDGSGEIGANIGQVIGDFGVILRQAFGTSVPKIPDQEFDAEEESGPTEAEKKEQAAKMEKAKKAGKDSLDFFYSQGRRLEDLPAMLGPEAFPVAMQVGVSMQRVVKEMRELVGKCIHSDARNALEIAGMHARNLTYITGHFLANGADIAEELADSVMGYETRNVTQVGLDVGRALRKIFLSNNQNAHLPEGMPGEAELANVTEGFLLGFFGPGTYMQINLRKDAAHPVLIDMHSCIRQDVSYFQQIWAATLFMFAQGATSGKALNSETSKIEFGTTLAFSMMELPSALERCGLSEKQQGMIMDSVKALGAGMQTKFQLPKRDLTKDQWAEELAITIKDWSEHRWEEFGEGLGALLQQSALHVYPEKYSLDSTGALQAQFETRGAHSPLFVLLVPCSVLLAALVLVVRRHQSVFFSPVTSSSASSSKRAAQKPLLFSREPQEDGEAEDDEEGETETEVDVESQESIPSTEQSLLQVEAHQCIE